MVRLYWSLKGDLPGPSVSLDFGETWVSCQTLSHCRADCFTMWPLQGLRAIEAKFRAAVSFQHRETVEPGPLQVPKANDPTKSS